MKKTVKIKSIKSIKIELLRESLINGNIFITSNLYGNSMWPLVSLNDTIHIKFKKFQSLKKGEIVLFSTKDEIVLHRIVKIENNTLFTRGDNKEKKSIEIVKEKDYFGILILVKKKRVWVRIGKRGLDCSYYLLPLHKYFKKIVKIKKI